MAAAPLHRQVSKSCVLASKTGLAARSAASAGVCFTQHFVGQALGDTDEPMWRLLYTASEQELHAGKQGRPPAGLRLQKQEGRAASFCLLAVSFQDCSVIAVSLQDSSASLPGVRSDVLQLQKASHGLTGWLCCSRKAEDRKRRRKREEQEDDADREQEVAELAAQAAPSEPPREALLH